MEQSPHLKHPLSPRERQMLELAIEGYTLEESASFLGISPRTAKYYSDCLRIKLGVAKRRELIRLGRKYL